MSETVVFIFSKDRPLQLDLTLGTFYKCCKDVIPDVKVLYRATNEGYQKAYEKLAIDNFAVMFFEEDGFKENLEGLLRGYKYVLFVVDDCIFVDDFSIDKIERKFEKNTGALGFSFRLGKNTTTCFTLGISQEIPKMTSIGKNTEIFNWTTSEHDFRYPLEVSSSMYRVDDIMGIISPVFYRNPNTLEDVMYYFAGNFVCKKPRMMCYTYSRAFCNPQNITQTTNPDNRKGNNPKYSKENMLSLFASGFRIDQEKFYGHISNSPHELVDYWRD